MGDQKFSKLAEIQMTEKQAHDELVKIGIPELDAGLITDCLNVGKFCSWLNTDTVTPEAVAGANALIASKNLAAEVKVTRARFDKLIWEVARRK
ncbi:hypothetical protein J4441_05785 [Candidatus Micrarchaeota archaeon]|nr:hypothetical protein [Candidatus Micrarchaeota archaeon]